MKTPKKIFLSRIPFIIFFAFLVKDVGIQSKIYEKYIIYSATGLLFYFLVSSEAAYLDLDGEVSGSSPSLTKDFKNGIYCSSAYAGQNDLR